MKTAKYYSNLLRHPVLHGVLMLFILLSAHGSLFAQDLNTLLMNSTFQITGPAQGGESSGTIFILGKQLKSDPAKGYYVLVTAKHVLDSITGDTAVLKLRGKRPEGTYYSIPTPLRIRNTGTPLYRSPEGADVAVMYVGLPSEAVINLLPTSFLVGDDRITTLEIHPGDELLCLGFPLAIDFNTFPVIRSGTLASYPLTPSKDIKTFFYNFHVFPGNSGGPVYFSYSNRIYNNATNVGLQQGIMGLVSQQLNSNAPKFETSQLDMAVIIPSSIIRDAILLLPESPDGQVVPSPASFLKR